MVRRLEKTCNINDVTLGHSYNLGSNGSLKFRFIITQKSQKYIRIKYFDGTEGAINVNSIQEIWEHPLSSLEKELM